MAYVRIGRWEHTDLQGTAWKLDLFEDGAVLDTAEYKMTGPMFTLTYEGDLFKEGRLELEWLIENSTQYAKAAAFVDGSLTTYLLELYKDGSIYWRGFLDPRLIELTEADYPRRTKLTFKDGLSLNVNFARDTGANYDRLIELLAECLPFTNDIKTYTNWTHGDLSTGDWLYQTYLDRYVFRKVSQSDEDADTDITYREVLNELLFACDLTCIQSDGDWHLMQRDNLDNATYTRYNYTSAGAQGSPASDSSVNLDLSIDSTNRWMLPSSSAFWQGGVRQTSYTHKHETKSYGIRFLPDGYRIDTGDPDLTFEQTFFTDGTYKLFFFTNVTSEIDKEFESVKTDCSVNIEVRVGSASAGYVYWDGREWTTTQTDIENLLITGRAVGGLKSDLVTRFTGTIEFTTSAVPDQYDGTIRLSLKKATKSGETVEYTLYQDLDFSVIGLDDNENSTELLQSLTTDRETLQFDQLGTIRIGEGPTPTSRGALRYSSGASFPILTLGDFNRVGVTESQNLGFMILRSRMDFFRRSRKTIRAEVYGEYEPHKILDYDSKRFVFDRGVFVGAEGRWRTAYFIEINPESATSISATDTFNISASGVLPEALTPVSFEGRVGIPFVDPFDSDVNEADLLTTGAGAPTTRSDNTELQGGEIVYNTQDGDTTPYRFVNLPIYQNLYDFRTSADGFVGTNATVTFGEQAATIGERGTGRGLLEVTCTATGSGAVYIQDASPAFDGYMRAQVFIPSTNSTLLGVKAFVGGSGGSAVTTTDAWTDINVGGFVTGGSLSFYGTNNVGQQVFTRTANDIFLIRNVDAYGNVVNVSAGTVTNYDPQSTSTTYRANVDILLVRNINDDSIESWGYITAKTGAGHVDEVANTAAPTGSGYFLIYGVWRGAFTSIKGDYITTGTLDASQVNVTNLDASNITTWAATVTGTLTIGSGGSIAGSNYTFNDTGGTIAGWTIDAAALTSAASGARIELRQDDKRVIIHNGTSEIVAMGYLDGLTKNAGGTFPTGTYGFWAKAGDKLEIDGDIDYNDGDWIIQSEGLLQSSNFVAGTSGFQIKGDGSAEFNDVTARGTLTTTNFSGTSAGVTIDSTGVTINEPLQLGDINNSGKLVFIESGGDEVIEIKTQGFGAYNDIAVFRGKDSIMWFYCDDGATGDESQIVMYAENNPIGVAPFINLSPELRIDNGGLSNTTVLNVTGNTVLDGELSLDPTVATAASAGTNGDVPGQVVGYIVVNIGGTNRKIPYYAE